MTKQENFDNAFSSGVGSCVGQCACGKLYYDRENSYDWEEGELEKLKKDPDAIGLGWSVSWVEFQGQAFIWDCDCWKARREQICDFLDGHAHEICRYFALEKERRTAEANTAPVVEL